MSGALAAEIAVHNPPRIFFKHPSAGEVVPPSEITDRLELTRGGKIVEGISQPLIASVCRGDWFSIDHGRIYVELRNAQVFQAASLRRLRAIKVVDFDDTMVSATNWHAREQEMMGDFGVPVDTAKELYEMSKIIVPGKAEGEKRYTPRLNLVLLTTQQDGLGRGLTSERALAETMRWNEAVKGLINQYGEGVLGKLAVDPKIQAAFLGNRISKYVYDEFTDAVFDPSGPASLKFIATRGKIEGPLGQVHKVHSSGIMSRRRAVDMVIYTNDIKAETLIYLSNLLSDQMKRKTVYLFDDNVSELVPYLDTARQEGLENIFVIQVAHPGAKRRGDRIDLEPVRTIGREGTSDTILRYYTTKPNLRLSAAVISPL